ncbi:ligand-binding sensor domain-containing diguanylate cyclase [Dyella acidisoli]|uniref:diguanylate cyclase n=1 Tax=Dyella acidisoli TaxID=1867834 RepID=A0ABQ5XNS3_9GAMM|nr:diguanylate cyclase [Dyella acidisoli]GLQ92044.1 GGDEF domain-containing protein [Dyella acidisoli]
MHANAQAISLATFTQSQGLRSLEDNCLLEDRIGFVYVCTENGLFRFDGHAFQRIGAANGLHGSFISALHQDSAGRLWVGTLTGLYVGDGQHFEPAEGSAHPLSVDPGAMLADLGGRLYAVSQHRLWLVEPAGTQWRIQPRFDAAALRATPVLADITSVFSDGHTLWFGCGKSLCQLIDNQLHVWDEHKGVPADTWTSYLLDRNGTLWVRSPLYIRTLSSGSAAFANHDLPGARVVTAYLDMIQDDQGRMLTRANDGLARWEGDRWRIFDKRNGLPDIGIDALLYDRSHVLWIGTYGRGVLQWRGYDQFESWQTAQGLDSSPSWAIARAQTGALWVGDELGGSVLAPGSERLTAWPLKAPPLAQETIGLYALPDGDMLAAYYSGELLRYHAREGRTEEVTHSPAYIHDLFVDSRGSIWLCTERGLYVHDGHKLRRAGANIVPDTVFSDAKEDAKGRLWFSGEAGLFRLDHGQWTRIRVTGAPANQNFTHIDVLPAGDLYLAGNFNGVWHGRITDGDTLNVQHVVNDLLDDTRVYFIRHDRRGWLWIGGTDGVELFNGQGWRRLTEDDGLIWDDIGEDAFFEDQDGSVWIGTTNGISHIPRPESLGSPDPLNVAITELNLGGVAQKPASAYRFDYASEQPLTLHLATLGAPTRRTLQYHYRLQGLEHNWVNSDRLQVDYPPLPPGNFVFEVAAYDPDSRQLSQAVQLPLHIVPPWWQRLPAVLGALLLVAFGIALMWHMRTRHLRARARTLEHLVAVRTRELEVDKQALEEARAALWQQATHDALTGLPNRPRVLEILTQAIIDTRKNEQPLVVALIDLDHFKRINDHYGHLAGDAVLIEAAARLREALPASATPGRYGGEEILAVVPGVSINDPAPFEALRHCIAQRVFTGDGTYVEVTCSIGVAWLQPQDSDGFDLIRRADAALYIAKTSGRNRVVIAGDRRKAH